MTKRITHYKKKVILISIILAMLFILFSYPIIYIRIQTDYFYCYFYANHFSLSWQHSVEKQRWIEFYQQKDQQLVLYETWLQTFGAGTPNQGEGLANILSGYIGYKTNIIYPELNWTISSTTQGSIHIGNNVFPIYQLLPDYSKINIQAQKSSLAFFLLGRSCYE